MDWTNTQWVVAATAWAENRSGGVLGMQSVCNVIVARANHPRWWGRTLLQVCLDPWQFSTWNAHTVAGQPEDANYLATIAVTPQDSDFAVALGLAAKAIAGSLPDVTEGADSYYDLSIGAPKWVVGARLTVIVAGQVFWRTELGA